MSFERETVGVWHEPEGWRDAITLWCAGHELMERYDRSVCTGKDVDGTAVPMTPDERSLINRYAARVSRALYEIREARNLDPDTWHAARREVNRWTPRQVERAASPEALEEIRSYMHRSST